MKLTTASLKKSNQNRGKYEEKISPILTKYLVEEGYQVKNHVSLNIAWGTILSQIDILGIKENELTIFEIKTKQDNLSSYRKQYNKIKNFIDYYYIVVEKEINLNHIEKEVGLIQIKDNIIEIRKKAKKQPENIKPESLEMLKKSDLLILSNKKSKKIKNEVSKEILHEYQNLEKLKKEIQKIILNI